MSILEVLILRPFKVVRHPQADRLDIATFRGELGFQAIIGKDQFSVDDLVIYVPPDSVVSEDMAQLLNERSKIKLDKNRRIRGINIRGVFSEGLVLDPKEWLPDQEVKEGDDVTEVLGITKYEPPPPSFQGFRANSRGKNIWYENPHFFKYTDINRLQRYPNIFNDSKEVCATKKLHGTNWRAGIVSKPGKPTLWQKVKRFFSWQDSLSEYLVGSHKTVRNKASEQGKKVPKLPPQLDVEGDVYLKISEKYDIEEKIYRAGNILRICGGFKTPDERYEPRGKVLPNHYFPFIDANPEVIFFGEVVGPGIQCGYQYGIEEGDHELRIFDIMAAGKFLDYKVMRTLCVMLQLPVVEEVYLGPWLPEKILPLAEAVDQYGDWRGNREGIVIKDTTEDPSGRLRKIAKVINPAYLIDKKNTDNH